jgi:hypothetical protein
VLRRAFAGGRTGEGGDGVGADACPSRLGRRALALAFLHLPGPQSALWRSCGPAYLRQLSAFAMLVAAPLWLAILLVLMVPTPLFVIGRLCDDDRRSEYNDRRSVYLGALRAVECESATISIATPRAIHGTP